MASPSQSPNPSPDSSSATSETRFPRKAREGYTIDFYNDPSPQEIADYTIMGGNLLAIDNYARKHSRNGESFLFYEAILDRISKYYRDFLAQKNRARFEEETPKTGDEGESSRRSPNQPPNPKKHRADTSPYQTEKKPQD